MKFLYLLILLCLTLPTAAQYRVSGTVVDAKDRKPMASATVALTAVGTDNLQAQSTDANGKFSISVPSGNYTLRVIFTGYSAQEKTVTVKDADLSVGTIRLKEDDHELQEVKAVGTIQRQEQRGDTTIFNAAAFKVNPDATTEDLIKKMPGMVVSSDGSVTHGGETVKKVLVDGKEFFGSDASIALKNIDASMVDKIEVFDKASEQSEFTGFSDGNEERTINILTKMGIKSGEFGRVYGGYGTDEHYEAGGNYNYFYGEHRVSVIGMLNNVNQLNFSFDDVTGAMSNGGGRAMRGMGGGGRSGLNRTGAIGANYNFEREDKLKIETSYFFNYNRNENSSSSNQEYFTDSDDDAIHTYDSESGSLSHNYNHRGNLRLKWTINDNNSLIFSPSISWQNYDDNSNDWGADANDNIIYKYVAQNDDDETTGYSLSGDLTYRHRFSLPKRTATLRLTASTNSSDADSESQSGQDNYTDGTYDDGIVMSQITTSESSSYSYSAKATYNEPFGENFVLQLAYEPSVSISDNDKRVNADSVDVSTSASSAAVDFSNYRFSPLLSNKKESTYTKHSAGIALNYSLGKQIKASVGVDFQHSILDGDQTYPYSFDTHRTFTSLVPNANLRIKKDKSFNFRITYRASTSAPSISQLQNVVDVSNIRKYTGGNENLGLSTTHSLRLQTAMSNVETSRFLFLMGNVSFVDDYIATSSIIASSDTLIDNDITLPSGTQYSKPINMDGYVSAGINLTMSSPVSWLGSNVNLTLGANFNKKPSMYNNKKVTNKTNTLTAGLTIGSSFSENIDFNVGYRGNYNIVKTTSSASSDYNYYSHTANADITWLFANQRLVLTNSLNHNFTCGMGDDYDSNYLLWNAAFGVKVFKDRRGEIKLRVNDILDSSESTQRSIQDAYIQTSSTDVLRRYAMITFTYKFKNIGDLPTNERKGPDGGFRGGPPPDGPGGGPGGMGGPF